MAARKGTGILMLNMGGPSTLGEVSSFLRALFSDPELIPLPLKRLLPRLLAARRTPKITEQYRAIGGGSPIGAWTQAQGNALCELLDKTSPATAPHKGYTGFRYARPFTADALAAIKSDAPARVVVFSQYAQFSCPTSGSSINDLVRQVSADPELLNRPWSLIDRWPANRGLARAFSDQIRAEVSKLSSHDRANAIVLFSAHSLPVNVVDRGDPYPYEVSQTARNVMADLQDLKLPYQLVWQSKVGPLRWVQPSVSDALKKFRAQGRDTVIVVPVSFTSDHIETLYELDIEYKAEAEELGYKNFVRVASLNANPAFISGLADEVVSHIQGSYKPSTQYASRCPGCTNPDCGTSRAFFLDKQQS